MVDINLLRDTEDPEAEGQQPDRYHPPKLSDYAAKGSRGPSPTSQSPRPTFGQALRSFFGIRPRQPKPRILSKRAAPERDARPTATVPFRAPQPAGALPRNIPPRSEEFTVGPRIQRAEDIKSETPTAFRGEKAVEDLFAEPTVLGGSEPRKRAPTPPAPWAPKGTAPVTPATPVTPPKPEDLMEEILRDVGEPPEGSSVRSPKPAKQAPKPAAVAAKPTPSPERPTVGTTIFEPLTLNAPVAKPVVKRNAPGGHFVAHRAESFFARVLRIAASVLPKRNEALPQGEGPEDLDVNLVPEELSAKLNLGDKIISLSLVTLVVAAVIGLSYTGIRIYETRIVEQRHALLAEIDAIRGQTVAIQTEQRNAIAFKQRADAIDFALGRHVRWTLFLDSLQKYTEKDVYFVNFAGDLSGALTLTAFGSSYDSVARQYATFEAADDFVQTVTIGGAQKADNGEVSFTVSLQLTPSFYLEPAS